MLRGIRLRGGDLPSEEGGGGVSVDKGELDGCAFLCEQNSRGQYYTYDKQSNLCYLKYERGQLVNVTESSRFTSGSTLAGGCAYDASVLRFDQGRRNWAGAVRGFSRRIYPDNYYDDDYDYDGYNYDNVLDTDVLSSRRPIIIINNNYSGRKQTVREILALAAADNPYLRRALGGFFK